jgi:hypothetical protein
MHTCKSQLIGEMTKLIGVSNYFIICMGNLNYFYCNDVGSIAIVREFLMAESIVLHELPEDEMLSVIDSNGTKKYQTFHGNPVLLNKFREKSEVS